MHVKYVLTYIMWSKNEYHKGMKVECLITTVTITQLSTFIFIEKLNFFVKDMKKMDNERKIS